MGTGPGLGRALTLASGVLTFVLAVLLVPARITTALSGWLRVDALSVVFLVAAAFLYAATAVFAIGYVHPSGDPSSAAIYSRRFFAGLNLFAWAMAAATVVNGLALLFVAIEVTTVVSALLVAIDDTDGSTEAAWKYVLIASMGLGLALLATVLMYYAGSTVFGHSYELFYPKLLSGAAHFPPQVVRSAFVLAVLGYGTKMGLVPVHTWLPDAHSEAPTPVSAILSGALLAVSFYAILRFYQVTASAIGPAFPRGGAARIRCRLGRPRRSIPCEPARLEATLRLLERRAHGCARHRHVLLGTHRGRGSAAARPCARSGEIHRVLRRRQRLS